MESLSKVIMESLVKDKKSEKTYHIGKKNFIKLAKAYCRYEMPKMNHVEFRQYQGTCWLNFLNENNHPVEITLDKVWGKYHIRVSCRSEEIDNVTTLENKTMEKYFEEKGKVPDCYLTR